MRSIERCVARRASMRVFIALIGFAAALCGLPAAAEIYKCSAKDGTPLYQNFPCPIDSLGLPSSPAASKGVPVSAATSKPQKVAATKIPKTTEPRVGMTGDEVRSLLGDPESVEEDEPSSGRVSMWRYPHGVTLQLDHKQRVFAIQRQD
jgi:hypothetical protein